MPRDDDFDHPFFRVRFGGSRMLFGGDEEDVIDMDASDEDRYEYRDVRRRVRRRLRFVRHLVMFLALNGLFLLLDAMTGGSGPANLSWSLWVALIWGVFIGWEFISHFVAPSLWGREAEERMVQRELRRRRGT
ncbi:MAG: 2TM domain-containing protein [Dehalococcoidia bacterium]